MAKNKAVAAVKGGLEKIRGSVSRRCNIEKFTVDGMHKLYYSVPARTWDNTFWFGIPILKCPLDMWIYQETIYSLRPDLIIETGTARGGSALFMAHLCDILNHGKIVTVDIKREEGRPRHGKITYLTGSSTSDEVVKEIGSMIGRDDKVFVILDSDHTMGHVLKELHIYKKFVSMGSYMIVEDSNVNGHPVAPGHGPGPMEAIKKFLSEDKSFIIDKEKEKFFLTFNPRGYLKRVG